MAIGGVASSRIAFRFVVKKPRNGFFSHMEARLTEMGRAEELFERVITDGPAEIQRMIGQPITEQLFLDYKRVVTTAGASRLDPSDRKNLAKAISGFGNSEGGIIVWGVACDNRTGDIPTDDPCDDPVAFKTLLDGAVGA